MLKRLRRASSAPAVLPGDGVAVTADACRNCGTPVQDAYCPHCGQETTIALPTARAFLREAAGRYVALDGRTWRTIAGLVVPGFLTREYLAGRRRRYVRPGRLFLKCVPQRHALEFGQLVSSLVQRDRDAVDARQRVTQLVYSEGNELALQNVPLLHFLAKERVLEEGGGEDADRRKRVAVGLVCGSMGPGEKAEASLSADQW